MVAKVLTSRYVKAIVIALLWGENSILRYFYN